MRQASQEFRDWVGEISTKIIAIVSKLIANGDEHDSMMMVFGTQGEISVNSVDMGDKDQVAYAHQMVVSHPDIVKGAVLITEVWTAEVDRDEIERTGPPTTGSLEARPDKGEALLLNARNEDMQLLLLYRIVRPAEGKVGSTLEEPKIIDPHDGSMGMVGRFVDPAQRTVH